VISRIPLAAIVGPTATGKSEIALRVASRLGAEIVSVDSAQVYRGMDIGTAKLPPEKRVAPDGTPIPHHLIDIVDPDQPFSVAQYQKLARKAIEDIHRRGKLPLLVGGTGLYFQAVVDPYVFPPMPGDPQLRQHLEREAEEKGNRYLYDKLKEVDPVSAQKIHPQDRKRIIRALEVYYLTGQPISRALELRRLMVSPYRLVAVALTMPRNLLYRRIEERVDKMIEEGLVEEVKRLMERYDPRLPAMQALGYKEIGAYLRGEMDLKAAIARLKRNTKRFAKRQFTWFRRDPRLRWWEVDPERIDEISQEIAQYIAGQLGLRIE